MRAIVDLENDMIVSWGRLYNEPEYNGFAYDIPDDYDPEIYDYIPSNPGIFDPNGFVRKSVEKEENI